MGMSIHLHYCCGKLKEITWSPVNDKCGKDHKMGSGKCCESKEISNKNKPDQDHFQLFAKSLKVYTVTTAIYHDLTVVTTDFWQRSPVAFAPPPPSSQPLHLLHCVFMI